MGALIWQLNDVWTGHSWSAIDVSGRPKPLYWALKDAFAPLLLTIHPIDGRPTLFVANDAPWPWPWEPVLRVRRIGFDGVVRAQHEEALRIERGTSLRVGALTEWVGEPDAPTRELLVVDADGPRATWFFDRDRALELPAPILTTTLHRENRSWVVEVRAETLVRDLVLAADAIDPGAIVEGGPQTLLPGETGGFVIVTDADLDAEALSGPPVLICANRFGALRASPPG